jgi:hypothetical protein
VSAARGRRWGFLSATRCGSGGVALPPWCRACHSMSTLGASDARLAYWLGVVSRRSNLVQGAAPEDRALGRQHRRQGPEEALRAAEALRAYVITLRPTWPEAQIVAWTGRITLECAPFSKRSPWPRPTIPSKAAR